MKLALFDFDGTITLRDTFIDFVRFSLGWRAFVSGIAQLSPSIAAFSLGVLNSTSFKDIYLSHYFKGLPEERFEHYCQSYAVNVLPTIVKPDAVERIKWHKDQGHRVIVVTASVRNWINAWCEQGELELISSELVFQNGMVTGRLASLDCVGKEKVRRIKEQVEISDYETIFAYGNSKGDEEMLKIADKKYYRNFKRWTHRNLLSYIFEGLLS